MISGIFNEKKGYLTYSNDFSAFLILSYDFIYCLINIAHYTYRLPYGEPSLVYDRITCCYNLLNNIFFIIFVSMFIRGNDLSIDFSALFLPYLVIKTLFISEKEIGRLPFLVENILCIIGINSSLND